MCVLLHSVPPTLQQATIDPCLHQRLLGIQGQIWVNLLWGHCSFILGPGTQGSVCALQESISQPCISSGSSKLGLMVTSSQEGLCHTQVCCTQSPCPCGSPLLTRTSTGDGQTQFCLSLCGVSGSWCNKVCLSPPSISGGNGD